MNSSIRNQIDERLSRYLAGQSSLAEFHDWFIPATWDLDAEAEVDRTFAHQLQLLLAEFSNGDRTEGELREAFWDLLDRSSVTVVIGDEPLVIQPITQTVGAA
jgi:hypothetical protein